MIKLQQLKAIQWKNMFSNPEGTRNL